MKNDKYYYLFNCNNKVLVKLIDLILIADINIVMYIHQLELQQQWSAHRDKAKLIVYISMK